MADPGAIYVTCYGGDPPALFESGEPYCRELAAWQEERGIAVSWIDRRARSVAAHDAASAARLRQTASDALDRSRSLVLIVTPGPQSDAAWVSFELTRAIDTCRLPIIAAYPDYDWIMAPGRLSGLWPPVLADRIEHGAAHVIHVPFRRAVLEDAIDQFSREALPVNGGLSCYSREAYASFGIDVR